MEDRGRPGSANAVVHPELWPETARLLRHATKVLWWLSIDDAFDAVRRFGGFEALKATDVRHLARSYHAMGYLADRDILLTAGLRCLLAGPRAGGDLGGRRRAGRSSPIPDARRLVHILLAAAFAGLTVDTTGLCHRRRNPALVLDLEALRGFRQPPGKDRMPREAAMPGCCVITGKRGAAANPFDIPDSRGVQVS